MVRWVVALIAGGLLFAFAAKVDAGNGGASASASALWQTAQTKAGSYDIHSRHRLPDGSPEYVNALILESSPYLLQHAHQPVAWLAWSDASRAEAKKTKRLIFLSIGYSTCHWCQVMARESFEDLGVARLLNRHFVSVKVDREERPDLDEHYLQRLELLTGSPGWPANFLLTPEGEVVAAMSYLARDPLADLLTRYARAWAETPAALRLRARAVERQIARAAPATRRDLAAATQAVRTNLLASFDAQYPGFGGEPRFFHAQHLQQHLAAWRNTGGAEDLRRFLLPLRELVQSATHDAVSGGFFRYSVHRNWNRPHFEKQLIDQALLLPLLAEAWSISGEALYREAALGIMHLVRERWTLAGGLLAAGQEASQGRDEGAYYLFSGDDQTALASLPEASREAFAWHPIGANGALPALRAGAAEPTPARHILAQRRARKTAPALDHKALTGWNAAFYAAAAEAAPLLGQGEWIAWAAQGLRRLLVQNRAGGQFARYSLNQQPRASAAIEDHAYLLLALARLHQADGAPAWIEEAEAWARLWKKPGALLTALRATALDRGAPSAAAVWVAAAGQLAADPRALQMQGLLRTLRPELEALAAAAPERHASLVASLARLARPTPERFAYLAEGHIEALLRPQSAPGSRELELQLRIAPGWHLNSARPYQKYLRPTRLSLRQGSEARLDMHYPEGEDQRLGDDTLSLYSGTVTLRGVLHAAPGTHLPLELHAQACNDQVCLAPEVVVLHP
jgi:uncharacterized protein YyaL (SSP411 family)